MDPVVVDFETEGIEARPAYPPRPVGVAIWATPDEPEYLAWGHPLGNNTTMEGARARLAALWAGPRPLLFHNAKFDLDVAEVHLGLKIPHWTRIHDTMLLLFLHQPHSTSLSLKPAAELYLDLPPVQQERLYDYLVSIGAVRRGQKDWGAHIAKGHGDVVGEYAIGDVVRTLKLYRLWGPNLDDSLQRAYDRERQVLPILLANEREGMRVDTRALERDAADYTDILDRADLTLREKLAAPGLNLDSDRELAAALKAAGVVTEFVKTKTGLDSVSKDNLTLDMFSDPEVHHLLMYRNKLTTALGTFIRPWLETATRSGGRIYTTWNQVRGEQGGARTGRFSSSPNFQNIPKDWYDKGDGFANPQGFPQLPAMRRYVLPDEGHTFVHRDYNQQEIRILAHFEDDKLMEAYNADPMLDVHTFVQQEIKRITGLELSRRAVKILNFGLIYGMGLKKLAGAMQVPLEVAAQVKRAQRAALPGIAELEGAIKLRAKLGEPIHTWGGRRYYCEPPKIVEGQFRAFDYKLLNYLIQGSAADVCKEALVRYDAVRLHGRLLVTVHDEINISVPAELARGEDDLLREAMESVEFDVKLLTEGKTGTSWGTLTKEEAK